MINTGKKLKVSGNGILHKNPVPIISSPFTILQTLLLAYSIIVDKIVE